LNLFSAWAQKTCPPYLARIRIVSWRRETRKKSRH